MKKIRANKKGEIVIGLILIMLFALAASYLVVKSFDGITGYTVSISNGPVCGNVVCESGLGENYTNCSTDCPVPLCNNNDVCEGIENHANCLNDCKGKAVSPEFKEIIDRVWGNRKQYFIDRINSKFANTETYALYTIQIWTNNLLEYAIYSKDYGLLDELAEVYLTTYDYLELKDNYTYHYYNYSGADWTAVLPLDPPANMWIDYTSDDGNLSNGIEDKLAIGQFLYLLSHTIHAILDIDPSERTENMNQLVTKFTPVILQDHYDRWVFRDDKIYQTRGWGCDDGSIRSNHYGFLEKKYNWELGSMTNHSYCNSVTDADMWIIAGVVEMLAANDKDPELIPINSTQKQELLDYINLSISLIQSRLTESNLTDFNGNPVKGLNFDLGVWNEHPDYDYSGYTGEAFPNNTTDNISAENISWDISHARRFVNVFNTLHNNRDITNQSFPNESVMRGLTNQVSYGPFSKDFEKPLFTNYMDGTGGWYRIGHSGKIGFGYAPYDWSSSLITGGYGFWSRYNNDTSKIMNSLWNMINSMYTPDVSGNGNNGFVFGPVWNSSGGYNGNGAYDFDGSSSYIDLGQPDVLNFTGMPDMSISLWVKADSLSNYDGLFGNSMGGGGSTTRFDIVYYAAGISTGEIRVLWGNGTSNGDYYSADNSFNETGKWYHIAFTSNGTNAKIYIDGIQSGSTGIITRNLASSDTTWKIGRAFNSASYSFDGIIDEVRIYNRSLSSTEIQEHYNETFNNNESLVAYLSFDEEPNKEIIEFAREYYSGRYYINYIRSNPSVFFGRSDSLELLMFLPSLAAEVVCNYNGICEPGLGENADNCPADCDIDGDGIIDTADPLLGNETNVNTNLINLTIEVNDSTNLSQNFTGKLEVKFKENGTIVIEFNFNFSEEQLILADLNITKQDNDSSVGSIVITSLNLTGQNETKTVYIDRIAGYDNLCIIDQVNASVAEVSNSCDGADEVSISCPGTTSQYTCSVVGDKYKLEGLTHSAVKEYTTPGPAPSPSGGGGGGGGRRRVEVVEEIIVVPPVEEVIEEKIEEEILSEEKPVKEVPAIVEKPEEIKKPNIWPYLIGLIIIIIIILSLGASLGVFKGAIYLKSRFAKAETHEMKLTKFIDKVREHGYSNEEIKSKLLSVGWQEDLVDNALRNCST